MRNAMRATPAFLVSTASGIGTTKGIQEVNMNEISQYAEQIRKQAAEELGLITAGKKAYLRPEQWKPVVFAATAPETGVTLDGGPMRTAFERNIWYLNAWYSRTDGGLAFSNDKNWWETVLHGSSEGRMIAAAAHTLRWGERADMRRIVNGLVGVVKARQRADGYCLPYDESQMAGDKSPGHDERRNYDRVNLTRGMVAASMVGNRDALEVMRKFYDWLYASPYCAGLLGGPFDGTAEKHNVVIGAENGGSSHNCNNGHEGSLLMYFSPVGKPEDLVAVERYFVQDFFIDASRRREALSLSHYPLHIAHSYVLLAYKAWLDHYRATGATKYIEAAKGAWDIVHDHFLHIGGSLAICEHVFGAYPPDSFYIHADREHHTGENCGSVFWADINHRLLQLFPEEAKYADQIEQAIFNNVLANQAPDGRIRYHARLEKKKENSHAVNTCCEVMGSPFIASFPQYMYSIAPDGLYVNLYGPSTITWKQGDQPIALKVATEFPFDGGVKIVVSGPVVASGAAGAVPTITGGEAKGADLKVQAAGSDWKATMKLRLRIPGWVGQAVAIQVNGVEVATGKPGAFVTIDREWREGDAVSFCLPMALTVKRYMGVDKDPNHERYALMCGPILMALVGATDLDIQAAELPSRLKPIEGNPLHFVVKGKEGLIYYPYWMIDQEGFTCFPTMR
jgi:DUF1680 family protein